jgi:hypothetical protein
VRWLIRWLARGEIEAAFRDGREAERTRMLGDAYWFTEDEDTFELLHRFVRHDVATTRQWWRQRRSRVAVKRNR